MRNWTAWTEEETRTLKANAAAMTADQLAELLGRTRDSIKGQARKLGVSLRKHGEACSWAKYSNAIVDKARDLHERGVPPRKISEQLSVPYWNVCDFVYFKRGLGYGYETA